MTQSSADREDDSGAPGKPSQAEGERDGAESTTDTTTEVPAGKPSQAEGDRETVDQDLDEQGS